MPPPEAVAECPNTEGIAAFQPKRPSANRPVAGSTARFGRPETPSPSRSAGSAAARMSSGSMASNRPRPIICGATRGDTAAPSARGPKASCVNRQCGFRGSITGQSDGKSGGGGQSGAGAVDLGGGGKTKKKKQK